MSTSRSSARPTPTDAPVDPDVDVHVPAQRRQRAFDPAVLATITAGGVLGAEARYALSVWVPHTPGGWPVATWGINLTGSLLLGALMVVLTELTSPHRLVRPFLGVGLLGGYTTFSTAMVEVQQLILDGRAPLAMAYLVGTAVTALAAAALGSVAMRAVALGWRRRSRARGGPR